ncbi:hypothetical protein LUZ62_046096 [Rhynchospora pubera]|uniref:Uncharacterized protein n=1 Tax=Rhynchospora pubera TaxID=906938 RepID=A0AAV8FTJ1_9POAL|nr:hypothetical protein LUZ62_046096 [Rhynchospora pubera]
MISKLSVALSLLTSLFKTTHNPISLCFATLILRQQNSAPIVSTINQQMDWLTGIGFTMLTSNSSLEIYRSKGDHAWSVAFVVSAYFSMLLLFWCLMLYIGAAPNEARRRKLKIAIWSLLTFLTAMFSYKQSELMLWPVALVAWATAVAVSFGVFYEFFIHRNRC